MQLGFYVDMDRCVGCHSCAVACKAYNHLPPQTLGATGPHWRRIVSIESGVFPAPSLTSMSLSCAHCGQPACLGVCPTKAISKRPEDGVVLVDATKCIGCRACLAACPFGVPQFGDDGKMQKCNFCLDRLAQGQEPVCVGTCPAGALRAGSLEELSKLVATKRVRQIAVTTQPSMLVVGK